MNSNFSVSKEILATKGELIGQTSGNSMYPLFRSGKDKAVIVPLSEKLSVNDVLLYRKRKTDEVILHRIVKFKRGMPVLRGDNLYKNEFDITENDILGIMKGFYRNGKYYDCKDNFGYNIYIIVLRISYPFRLVTKKAISLIKRIKNCKK